MSKLLVKKLSKMNFFQFGKPEKDLTPTSKDQSGKGDLIWLFLEFLVHQDLFQIFILLLIHFFFWAHFCM